MQTLGYQDFTRTPSISQPPTPIKSIIYQLDPKFYSIQIRKVKAPCRSTRTPASAPTSRSTESVAAPPPSAAKSSATSIQRLIRGVATPPKSRLHPIAQIEDEESIQTSLMEVINALVRNTIDLPRAQLILRALNIAVRNAPRVHFRARSSEIIREIPEYPAAPAVQEPPSPALHQAGALQRIPRPKVVRITPPPPPKPPAAAQDPARPKPPAKAKPAPAARTAASRRSG
jgi:hypothetical protein